MASRPGLAALVLLATGCAGGSRSEPAGSPSRPGPTTAEHEIASAEPPPAIESAAEQSDVEHDAATNPMQPGPVRRGRGWLGVELGKTGPASGGVVLGAIVPGSPAASAGLQPGDVLLRVEDRVVNAPRDVVAAISRVAPGSEVAVSLRRDDRDRLVRVRIGEYPGSEGLLRMRYIGQPAPGLEDVKTAAGTFPASLGAMRGRVVVMEFWASWCIACRALMPTLNDWHRELTPEGVAVVGITTDPVLRAAEDARSLGMLYPILSDESGKTTGRYSAMALPTVFVIDREGIVRDVMVGYDPMKLRQLGVLLERMLESG